MNLTNLQAELEDALDYHRVVGASVAVFYQGQLTTASAGAANVTTGIAITDDTLMHIGSIAKIFTTTLIMQLVDQGRIDLDDLILKHLPELKLKDMEALQRITVKMLLNHTSGIDADMLPDQGHDEEVIGKAVARFAELRQVHKPATDYSYCNGAFVIAGYLAQRVTGKSWYDLIKEKIYAPLNMQYAVTLPEEALLYRASVGHHLDPETNTQVRTSFSLLPISFSPGGTTLMMTAQDLVTFTRAHIANGIGPNGVRILSENSAKRMQQQTVVCDRRGLAKGFGLGWILLENGVIGHTGGAPGAESMLIACPKKDFAAAILTNSAHGKILINDLMERWFEEFIGGISPYGASIEELSEVKVEDIDCNCYVGSYENIVERYDITASQSGLTVSRQLKFAIYDGDRTKPTTISQLVPLDKNEFMVKPTGERCASTVRALGLKVLTFKNPDIEGHMQHLGVTGGRLLRRTARL